MRVSFAGVSYAIAMLFFINMAVGQDRYHQLTVNDFQGIPHPAGDNSIAYTHCSIDYRYHVHGENNRYRLTFDVKLLLDKNQSWMDKKQVSSQQMMAQILKHEQGHYTIALMEQQEILREAARTRFDANYQSQASALFNRIHNKYDRLNVNYDEDTKHMCDNVQQHSWDVYFQKRLAYMPPTQVTGY